MNKATEDTDGGAGGAGPFAEQQMRALCRMRSLWRYYRWIYDRLRPYVGQRVFDAGCGIGNLAECLGRRAEHVLAADFDPANVSVLRRRFAGNPAIEACRLNLKDLEDHVRELRNRRFDTIVCLDVLEHLADDVQVLRSMRALATEGTHLLVKVPACPALYGTVDEASGHYRRYSPEQLRRKAMETGWNPLMQEYMNLAGVLPYYVKSRLRKRSTNFSCSFSSGQLSLINAVVPMLRLLDRLTGPPVGQSLLLIAEARRFCNL